MPNRIEIIVVKHKDELLFQTGGVLFDSLWAFHEFADGQVSIYRNDKIFDKTDKIYEVGTHAAQMVFSGLTNLFSEQYRGITTELNPEYFQEGDKLVLEIQMDPEWNLADQIRLMSGMNTAVHSAFAKKKEWNIGDLNQRVCAELAKKVPELQVAQIIRFR